MTDAEKIKLLQDTLKWVLADVREWCEAVSNDSSWDGWDEHYKSFFSDRKDQPSGLGKAHAALASTST